MHIIETRGLTKKFGDFVANDKIHLTIENQEIRCIVGENGAGKTTLMNMLYGIIKPTSGEIYVKGEKVAFNSPADAIRSGLGMVHQHFKLVPSLTIYENVLLGAELTKNHLFIHKKREIDLVQRLIRKYKFDLNPLDRIEDISIGEQQHVEILKMLCRDVDILIFDEPTAVLTPQEVDKFIISLKELRKQGKTIIIITHKLREVMELADRITVIRHGRLIGTVKKEDTTERKLAQMMVGHQVALTVKNDHRKVNNQKDIYQIEHLSAINDHGQEVLKNISLNVRSGEIVGVAGVEGNGQTELIHALTGLMEVTKGSVHLNGKEMTNFWPDQCRQNKMGIIPEDRFELGLCATMSLADNSIAGYHRHTSVTHLSLLNRRKINALRDDYIKQYDIRVGDKNGSVGQLSGGNAQKLIIAREFEHKPDFLIACQPTRGIDIGSIEFIHRKLLEYRNSGHGVLLISSELSEIMALSDRIFVMYKGSIVGCVNPEASSQEEIGLLMAGIYNEKR